MSRSKVADLEVGQNLVKAPFVLSEPSLEVASNGSTYLRCKLQDLSGAISAKKWDVSRADILQYEGQVLAISGKVETYKNSPQVLITSAKLIAEEYDVADYVRQSEIPREEREARLTDWMLELKGDVGQVIEEVFSDPWVWDMFLSVPASQLYHHAWDGGLSDHVLSMLETANFEATRRGLDVDLLLAGVLLHDLGKIFDVRRVGLVWVPTPCSIRTPHRYSCIEKLLAPAYKACDTPEDVRQKLSGMVASHHGEHGDVSPYDRESNMLHRIDSMDSSDEIYRAAEAELEPGEISGWVRPVGGRLVR